MCCCRAPWSGKTTLASSSATRWRSGEGQGGPRIESLAIGRDAMISRAWRALHRRKSIASRRPSRRFSIRDGGLRTRIVIGQGPGPISEGPLKRFT